MIIMAFEVDYIPIDSTRAINRYAALSGTPVDTGAVALDLIGGSAQAITTDFAVTDSTVRWDSSTYGLYNLVAVGDNMRVIYDKS
jgi:hypothetical protein